MSSEEQKGIVERIVAGELEENSVEAQGLLDRESGARERLAEFRDLEGLLAAEAADVQEALAWNEESPSPSSQTEGRSYGFWFGVLGVAAALMVVFQMSGGTDLPGRDPRGVMLGGGSIDLTINSPVGAGLGFYDFTYAAASPQMKTSRVRVWAYGADTDSEPLLIHFFEGNTWRPSAEQSELLPGEITWDLMVTGLGGELLWGGKVPFAGR